MCQKVSHPMQVTLALERLVELLGSDKAGHLPWVFLCVWLCLGSCHSRKQAGDIGFPLSKQAVGLLWPCDCQQCVVCMLKSSRDLEPYSH